MGAVTGLIGGGGGAGGTSFNIQSPVSSQQANNAYTGVQNSLGSQQQLLQALQAQNGLANQSNVYGQLQNVAAGQGPNPAQAMLNQSTGQNVANQAALMAGQRGSSANAGLIARQAAQQGAATQQQAVGQGASLQAQQSLNALGAAGNLATTQAQQQIGQTNTNTAAQQAEQQNLLNSIAGQNSANAGLAQTQMQGQQGLIGGVLNSAGGLLGLAKGGEVIKAANGVYVQSPDMSNDQWNQMSANPNAVAPVAAPISQPAPAIVGATPQPSGPKSAIGKSTSQFGAANNAAQKQPFQMGGNGQQQNPLLTGMTSFGNGLGKAIGGLFSSHNTPMPQQTEPLAGGPGDNTNVPTQGDTAVAACGGSVGSKLKSGGNVPGKPKVGGAKNSYSNDNVKALLSPGEIVLPRSVTQSADPVGESAKFVAAVMAKKKVSR